MNASLISYRRGLMLLGVAALAACDTDRSVGPNPAGIPSTAAMAKAPAGGKATGKINITIVDKNQQPLSVGGAQFKVMLLATAPITVDDNGPQDADPALGAVQVKNLVAGFYSICQSAMPSGYAVSSPVCTSVAVNNGAVSVQFIDLAFARGVFGAMDNALNYVTGAVFDLYDPTGVMRGQIKDNTAPDLDPTPGKVELQLDVEGSWAVCPVSAPSGYVFASPPGCHNIEAKHGDVVGTTDIWVYPFYSAAWAVSNGTIQPDGFYTPLGPSTFSITTPNGGFSTTIVDNGATDYDKRIGMFAIKLPAAGWYSFCQTVAPANHKIASPTCKRLEVKYAAPAWGSWFISFPN